MTTNKFLSLNHIRRVDTLFEDNLSLFVIECHINVLLLVYKRPFISI